MKLETIPLLINVPAEFALGRTNVYITVRVNVNTHTYVYQIISIEVKLQDIAVIPRIDTLFVGMQTIIHDMMSEKIKLFKRGLMPR